MRQVLFTVAVVLGMASCSSFSQEPQSTSPAHKKHKANRLANESSPYLLLHAHNPVDWYPWGEEALARAKKEDKPIFLSIGYSSCYWCHVMEREVFSNEEIAEYMNEHFINVKLDREERPDLDDIYMTSLVIYLDATGSGRGGGWPMSMFLLPDGRPFAGGTYFPAESGPRGIGFPTVARRVVDLYKDQKPVVVDTAERLTAMVKTAMRPRPPLTTRPLDAPLADRVLASLTRSYDKEDGGVNFNPARPDGPKFPVPPKIEYLLHRAAQGDDQAREMATLTLDKMLAGGIRDHLAGGFHRYSTDRKWHVPHFEKMLYDQSQLATVYTVAWQQTQKPEYRQVAMEILDYVLSDLTGDAGGFYSALDAETNAIEGEYYVWDRETVERVLGAEDATVFGRVYGLDAPNPFEHGFVLHFPESGDAAADLKLTKVELASRLKGMRAKLLAERKKRKAPLLDDKVLASWNGLMIRSLADASVAFQSKKYRDAAAKAANFVLTSMTDDGGRLFRTWRGGKAKLNAYLDDYAFVISGLLSLYEATEDAQWLAAAERMQQKQDELFKAEEAGGYYFTSHDHEELIARTRNANDGVIPSGNSVSVRNLVRLAAITGKADYRTSAQATLEAFSDQMRSQPGQAANLGLALYEYLEPAAESGEKRSRNELEYTVFQVQNGSGTGDKKGDAARKKPVEAKAFLSVDKLPAGGKARVAMYCRIKKGWHINTNKPSPDYLYPTSFTIKSRYGTKLVNVKYPKYKVKKVEGEKEPFHLYEGMIVIYGQLEVPAAALGKDEELTLTINYQTCDDTTGTCMRPDKVVLKGKLPVSDTRLVKQINKDKFVVAKGKPGTGTRRQ